MERSGSCGKGLKWLVISQKIKKNINVILDLVLLSYTYKTSQDMKLANIDRYNFKTIIKDSLSNLYYSVSIILGRIYTLLKLLLF